MCVWWRMGAVEAQLDSFLNLGTQQRWLVSIISRV